MSLPLTQIESPSEHVQERAVLMWTRKIKDQDGVLEYRVCPHGSEFEHKSKSKRRVIIDLIRMTAKCAGFYSGIPCEANADFVLKTGKPKEPRMCCHVWAVLQQIKMNVRRQERKAA